MPMAMLRNLVSPILTTLGCYFHGLYNYIKNGHKKIRLGRYIYGIDFALLRQLISGRTDFWMLRHLPIIPDDPSQLTGILLRLRLAYQIESWTCQKLQTLLSSAPEYLGCQWHYPAQKRVVV